MTRGDLKNLIMECYVEALRKLHEDKEKDDNMIYGEGSGQQLPSAMDQMLSKFPTLKHCLQRLHTDDFSEFVSGIDYVSPRPTVFRINLSNGQDYTLKWMGKDFEMEIKGKSYYLGNLPDYQRALEKLVELYQEGPMGMGDEGEFEGGEEGGSEFGGGSGGGDFPGGEEFGGEGEPEGEEGGSEEEQPDLGDEDVDFEADADI